MNSQAKTPPAPWTHPPVGGVPEYTPPANESFGCVPVLNPHDMHEITQDEALEPATDSTEEATR